MTGIKVSKKRCVAGSYPCHTTYRGNRAISDEPFKVNSPEKEVSRNPTFRQQKFLKRSADDLDGSGDYGDSGPKLQCGGAGAGGGNGGGGPGGGQPGPGQTRPKEGLTKFSVEIVQQLEFTTSAANSQPQQISTNVTVKALTNASVKSDMGGTSSPKSTPETPSNPTSSTQAQRTSNCVDIGNLVECKQEPDSDFVDLEQCAAALEKDAQNNGASFPGFSEFIGDEGGDEIITSDAFKDLISEISDFHPEFMKDFDFDEHKPNINVLAGNGNEGQNGGHNVVTSITTTNQMKVESDSKEGIQIHQQHMIDVGKSSQSNVQYGGGQFDPNGMTKSRMPPYSALEFGKAELSPAAQTLKQMAEQHQHKTQLGMGFPGSRNPRSPYSDYQFSSNSDYINSPSSTNTSPSSGQFINKNIPPSSQNFNNQNQSTNTGNGQSLPDVKQEVMFSATQTQNFQTGSSNIEIQKRMQAMHQQQISSQAQSGQGPKTPSNPTMMGNYKQQYSPYGSPGGHGSPGYMPRGGQGSGGPFVPGSAPSRPPSVPGGSTTLQMSQAQQMQVNQQNSGQQIQPLNGWNFPF
ncbi:hypothetical protein RUM43_006245 [Polyplax serrata]|uniref:Neurogenic protein mastermind n=1 Tax=Polyplax serrata TaxID=468196 RepID=A0AAN8RV93_POLSC